jgi:hypothetical protein
MKTHLLQKSRNIQVFSHVVFEIQVFVIAINK